MRDGRKSVPFFYVQIRIVESRMYSHEKRVFNIVNPSSVKTNKAFQLLANCLHRLLLFVLFLFPKTNTVPELKI